MRRRPDPHQLEIDWTNHQPPAPRPAEPPTVPEALIQRLPWDFSTTFPLPTDEALEAGVLDESDCEPANLKALHEQHASHALLTLRALDKVMDARRRGIDPSTGKPPRTAATREKIQRLLESEPARLERWFSTLMETYADAFGYEAADAFAKAIRAWHAGVKVEADTTPPSRRTTARLPLPRPLPTQVARGAFGFDDHGEPVRPCRDEILAITEQHAERLIALFDQLHQVARSLQLSCTDKGRLHGERQRIKGLVRAALDQYAEDFGRDAAQQLERYAERWAKRDGLQT